MPIWSLSNPRSMAQSNSPNRVGNRLDSGQFRSACAVKGMKQCCCSAWEIGLRATSDDGRLIRPTAEFGSAKSAKECSREVLQGLYLSFRHMRCAGSSPCPELARDHFRSTSRPAISRDAGGDRSLFALAGDTTRKGRADREAEWTAVSGQACLWNYPAGPRMS